MVCWKRRTCRFCSRGWLRNIRSSCNTSRRFGWMSTRSAISPTHAISPDQPGSSMITADEFMAEAGRRGFAFYTGVPYSFLTPPIHGVLHNRKYTYLGPASEGEAGAIASGTWLTGSQNVAMSQTLYPGKETT